MVDTLILGAIVLLVLLTAYRKLTGSTTSIRQRLGIGPVAGSIKEEFEQGKSDVGSDGES